MLHIHLIFALAFASLETMHMKLWANKLFEGGWWFWMVHACHNDENIEKAISFHVDEIK